MSTLNPTYKEKGFSTTNFELNQINRQAISEAFNDLILERNPYLVLTNNDQYASALSSTDAGDTKFKFRSLGGYYVALDSSEASSTESYVSLQTDKNASTDVWFVYNQASKAWFVNVDIVNGDPANLFFSGDNVLLADPSPATDGSQNSTEVVLASTVPQVTTDQQRYNVYSDSDTLYRGLFRITASPLHRTSQPTIEIRNLYHNPSYSYLVIDDSPPTVTAEVQGLGEVQFTPKVYIHKRPTNPIDFKGRAWVGEIA